MTQSKLTVPKLTDDRAEQIVDGIALQVGTWQAWKKDRNMVLDMFSWIWEGIHVDGQDEAGIGNSVDEELSMWEHHQGKIIGHGNRG